MKELMQQIAAQLDSGTKSEIVQTQRGQVAVSITVAPMGAKPIEIAVGIDRTNAELTILCPAKIEAIPYILDDPDPFNDDARMFDNLKDEGWQEILKEDL